MWKPYTVHSTSFGNEGKVIETGLEYRFTDNNIRVYSYITDVFMISIHSVSKTDLLFKMIHNTTSSDAIKRDIEFVNKTFDLDIAIPNVKSFKNLDVCLT